MATEPAVYPPFKQVFLYDPANGIYGGTYDAQLSPEDAPGTYLAPVCSTDAAPPAAVVNQVAVYAAGEWMLEADYRGQTWYDQATGDAVEIAEIGQPASNLAATEPPPTIMQLIASGEAAAQNLLDSTAKAWGYDSLLSATSYANSAVTQYKAEAAALIAWRDTLWSAAFAIEQACTATPPTQTFPATIADFLALLPPVPARP